MAFTLVAAVGDEFVDRETVVEEMLETLGSPKVHMGFALIGPRRMGKTSILREVCRRLNQSKKTAAVYLSLWNKE